MLRVVCLSESSLGVKICDVVSAKHYSICALGLYVKSAGWGSPGVHRAQCMGQVSFQQGGQDVFK